jgi:hypothetical protein
MVPEVQEEKTAKRVNKNPESGTDRARQTLVEWTPDSGKRWRARKPKGVSLR